MANGNVSPTRVLEGQDARLARALHGIVYDKVHDEIIAPNPFAEAILFFDGGVDGEEAPIRMIQGPHTQIDGGPDWNTPDSVAYDPTYDEVYTRIRRGWGEDATPAILVFPRTGDGDIPPTRVLRGPKTLLNDPYRIGVDGANNILVIANRNPAGFLIFDRDADGDVAPGQSSQVRTPEYLGLLNSSKWILSASNSSQQYRAEGVMMNAVLPTDSLASGTIVTMEMSDPKPSSKGPGP